MTAELSYFRTVSANGQISRSPIAQTNAGTQSLGLSSSPQTMNAAPIGATIFCLQATEAMRYEYDATAAGAVQPVTATSHYLAAGSERWHDVEPGKLLSVRTA